MNDNPSSAPSDAPQPQQTDTPPATPSLDQEPATVGAASPMVQPATVSGPSVTPAQSPQTGESLPAPSASPQKPRKKKWMVGGIVAAIIVVLLAAAGSAYAFWYQNLERVVGQAMAQLMTESAANTSTLITSDSELATGLMNVKFKEFRLDAGGDTAVPVGDMNASMTIELNGRDYTVGGKARIVEDRSVYFQIVDLKDLVAKVASDFAGAEFEIPADVMTELEAIQNKWVKVTTEDMGGDAETYTCVLDAYERISSNKELMDENAELYEQHAFVTVKEQVESRNGNLGYNVEFDTDKLSEYMRASADSKATAELEKCEGYDSDETQQEFEGQLDSANATAPKVDMVVWVSRFGHELRQVDYTITAENSMSADDIVFQGQTTFEYGEFSVDAPAESVPFSDWLETVDRLNTTVEDAYNDAFMNTLDSDSTVPMNVSEVQAT